MSNLDGIINIMKPPDLTSFKVVSVVKRIFETKKAGHTGTLDPAAVGVLPVCLGKATKVIPFIPEDEKEYIAEITLGVVTDTLDSEGKIVKIDNSWQDMEVSQIHSVLRQFVGVIEQIPPMFSAVHHNGKRLYQLAREGKEVERVARKIEIKEIELLAVDLPVIKLRVLCSKGTYIRTLADDIGKELEVGAHLSKLIRSKSGPFSIEDSVTLEELEETGRKNLLSIDYPLEFPKMYIKEEALKFAQNGTELYRHNFREMPLGLADYLKENNLVSIYYDNLFISVNRITDYKDNNFVCKPLRVFNIVIE